MSAYEGKIEAIKDRLMTGWISGPDIEDDFLAIEFLSSGQNLGSALAQRDLSGDASRLTFEFLLPRLLADGGTHDIAARIGDATIKLENASYMLRAPQPPVPPVGFVDILTEAGEISGWAWYPDSPTQRAELEVLADNIVIGGFTAERDRPDLARAGIGDGQYGYRWLLPLPVLATARKVDITVRDKFSQTNLSKPIPYLQQGVADALTKISALEADLRLLRGAMAAIQDQPRRDAEAARELFDIVGKFFHRLAAAQNADDALADLRPLGQAADHITATLNHFSLPANASPLVSVFVADAPDAAATHATLQALTSALGPLPAEIFLLDTGLCPDAPLLPLVAQNLRYAKLPGSPAARCNAAMRLAAGGIVIFINGGLIPAAGWAEALPKFSRNAALFIGHAPGAGPGELFALRRSAWTQLGGLDNTTPSLADALAAFSARATEAGLSASSEADFAASAVQSAKTKP